MIVDCVVSQANVGWWNLLIVFLVSLLPLAVMAGWVWGRMAEQDARARTERISQ